MRGQYTYDRDTLERSMRGIWDESRVLDGAPTTEAPDPEMPKGPAPDPRKVNSAWDGLADAQVAWKRADLTLRQRQCILLTFGLDYTQGDIATELGVAQSTVSVDLSQGVDRMLEVLNHKTRPVLKLAVQEEAFA